MDEKLNFVEAYSSDEWILPLKVHVLGPGKQTVFEAPLRLCIHLAITFLRDMSYTARLPVHGGTNFQNLRRKRSDSSILIRLFVM